MKQYSQTKEAVYKCQNAIKGGKIAEILFESYPQMLLQSTLLFENGFEFSEQFTELQIRQIFSISISLISISWGCQDFVKWRAFYNFKVKLNSFFSFLRFISNVFFLLSRTLPLSLLLFMFPWFVFYLLFRFIIHFIYSFKFEFIEHLKFYEFKDREEKVTFICYNLLFNFVRQIVFFDEMNFKSFYYLVYYSLTLIENLAMFLVYFYFNKFSNDRYFCLILILIVFSYWVAFQFEAINWKLLQLSLKERIRFDLITYYNKIETLTNVA